MSTQLRGTFYDGTSSRSADAVLIVDKLGQVSCSGIDEPIANFTTLPVSDRLGNTPRFIDLGNGQRFETSDNDAIDALSAQFKSSSTGIIDRLERNLKLVAVAVLVLTVGGFLFVRYGIPALSEPIAALVPLEFDRHIGNESMEQIDEYFVSPSEIPEARQAQLVAQFEELLQQRSPERSSEYRLLFRKLRNIPNAFALPDGTLVVTDRLVELADNDEQIMSIVLHEIGHVEHRHSVQLLVRQSSLSLLVLLYTGDITAASSIVLAAPLVLAQAQYSQELEWEADTYSLESMQALGMDTGHFADIMAKLSQLDSKPGAPTNGGDSGTRKPVEREDSKANILDYLASHPASEKRIQRFEALREK